jgi:hypothetical protein
MSALISKVETETKLIQMSHDAREIGADGATTTVCLRCGAKPGSAKWDRGCRFVQLPDDEFKKKRRVVVSSRDASGVPHPDSDTFSSALEEYFGTADFMGGLISRMGRDLEGWSGSGNTADGVLPPYMTNDPRLFMRICATWRVLKALPIRMQKDLSDYYQGLRVLEEYEIVTAHREFFAAHEAAKPEEPKRARHSKTYSVQELADIAGVTRRHMHTLVTEAKVGTMSPRDGTLPPTITVSEDELNQLKSPSGSEKGLLV